MKTLKKLFSVSAIVALLGTLAPMYAFGATYTDELEDAYAYARANGVTTKNTIDEADMYGSLTRIAMAKMIANYATTVLWLEADTSRNCTFSDVTASLDAEYGNWVTNACQLGLMWIDDNGNVKATFDPKGTVTRAQFATALSRAISQAEDGEAIANGNPYYRTHIAYLNGKGIVKSEAEYDVNSVEKRGYVMLMMMRADKNYTPSEGCTTEQIVACALEDDTAACLAACSGNEEPEEEDLPGYATVSTKAAATQDVPYDAVKVKVGTITLKAGDNDTKVSSVEISRDGLFNTTNSVVNVALRNANIETDSVVVSNSTNKAKVKFSPALQLKAKESMTFDVIVDLAGAANTNNNDTHNFKVTDVVVSNGTSAGYPANLWTIKTTAAASKTFTAEFEQWDTPLKAGETWKKLVAVKVTFNNADGTLDRITLWATVSNTPSPKADLDELFANVKAYVDDKEVWTVSVDDEKIIISDLNLSKEKYDTVKVELRWDIISTNQSNTVSFNASNAATNASSVEATESSYGFGMKLGAVITPTANITVEWYDFVFKKAKLENTTVIPGTNNVLVFDSTIKTTTDVVIKKLDITTTKTTPLLSTDLKAWSARILINWEEYPLTDAQAVAATTANFPVNVNIDAGKEARIQILFNTLDTANGKDIKYAVDLTDVRWVEKNATSFAANIPVVNGDQVKFQKASVTVAAATETAPATRSLFANQEQEMWRFSIKANGEKVTVKWLTLVLDTNLAYLSDAENYVNSNLSLVDVATDDVITATFGSLNTTTHEIAISNMNYNIEKDKTANIKVMINMPAIDAAHFGKYMKLSTKLNSINASANWNDITTNAAQDLSTNYTLRNTAPEITLSKAADNMFKVTIKNVDDNDAGIEFNDLVYRVRTTASDNEFKGKVCIVDDINTITCPEWSKDFGTVVTYTRMTDAVAAVTGVYSFTPDTTNAATIANVATAYVEIAASSDIDAQITAINDADGALYVATKDSGKIILTAKTAGAIATAPTNTEAEVTEVTKWKDAVASTRDNFKLSKNAEKSLYILIDGNSIEPDVLKADISSLSYDKDNADYTDTLTAEKYSISRMLND